MKLRRTILLSFLIGFACSSINSQNSKLNFFASYNYGLGNLTAKVNSSLGYPIADEVQKLKSGTMNQFELGVFYNSFGFGIIHNNYATNAATNYENADVNFDGYFENGILSDKLYLSFKGLELLYKLPVFNKFDVTWKIGAGFQSYSILKEFNLMGTYPSHYYHTLTGSLLTTIGGMEINYRLWKIVGIGLEASIIPGNYTKLNNAQSPSYVYSDNVTRLSTGVKIKITI